ncbi:MAG: hypothetical protein R3B81_07055 [bacterium]
MRGDSPDFAVAVRAALGPILLAAGLLSPGACPAASLSIAPFAEALSPDSHLADYRWDVSVRPAFGVAAHAAVGRIEPGVRWWRASTEQGTGIPGQELGLDVTLTGMEGTARYALAQVAGVRLLALGSAGALRIGWSPSTLTIDAGGEPITVAFESVTEPVFGVGFGVGRDIGHGLALTVGAERRWFALDTAHRSGSEIVEGRENFGNWVARIELAHTILDIGGNEP